MAAAASYMPKGMPVDVVGYWFPRDGKGPVANDTNTVLRSATNPVLAHLFLELPARTCRTCWRTSATTATCSR